jgi:predicted nuclease of predicted toxin-antitoxin system
VRLLFDENLSRKLVQKLADLFPGSSHAATEALIESPDAAVWEYAKTHGLTIVTADADFYELRPPSGHRPK